MISASWIAHIIIDGILLHIVYPKYNIYISSLMLWRSDDITCKYHVIFWSVDYIFAAHAGLFYVYNRVWQVYEQYGYVFLSNICAQTGVTDLPYEYTISTLIDTTVCRRFYVFSLLMVFADALSILTANIVPNISSFVKHISLSMFLRGSSPGSSCRADDLFEFIIHLRDIVLLT